VSTRVETLVLGGGLAGLSAGFALARAGRPLALVEADAEVGGLARTISCNGFRFDLGGHRFHTRNRRVEVFVRRLLGEELQTVPRASQICLGDRYVDYPLQPWNALCGLGALAVSRILLGYAFARLRARLRKAPLRCVQDWVIAHFGRPLYEIYFRDYSEKVWGMPCDRIASEWMAQRIEGLSLGGALRRAFFKGDGADPATLCDAFLYPRLGIGRIADKLRAGIEARNVVLTGARVARLRHSGGRVHGVTVRQAGATRELGADEVISTIPLPRLVQLLDPPAPNAVLEAAARLRHRDLVTVALMLDRPPVTGLTWIYFPGKGTPFGRVHEPTNWSPHMAPPGKTLLVAEYFCFRGERTWDARDEELAQTTTHHLERLGIIRRSDVLGAVVRRVPGAYPLFEVGYQDHREVLFAHLAQFSNLEIAGRGGMFRYYNMDVAIESGLAAAETVLEREPREAARHRAPLQRRA
jgi:protoporphyrinogen oxidase